MFQCDNISWSESHMNFDDLIECDTTCNTEMLPVDVVLGDGDVQAGEATGGIMETPMIFPELDDNIFQYVFDDDISLPQPLMHVAPASTSTMTTTFDFVPDPPVKSKKTDPDQLRSIFEIVAVSVANADDIGLAKQDYVQFGDTTNSDAAAMTCRELDRNKDIALVLKMVSGVYGIPLHQVYRDLGRLASAPCVSCDKHPPQRGSLMCFYCAKNNNATMGELMTKFISKN